MIIWVDAQLLRIAITSRRGYANNRDIWQLLSSQLIYNLFTKFFHTFE